MMLGYANDYVMFVDSPLELGKKLETLRLYCVENDLNVNTEKTKIVVFIYIIRTRANRGGEALHLLRCYILKFMIFYIRSFKIN